MIDETNKIRVVKKGDVLLRNFGVVRGFGSDCVFVDEFVFNGDEWVVRSRQLKISGHNGGE